MNGPLQKFKDNLAKQLGGKTMAEARRDGTCTTCGELAIDFTDDLSRKEYRISGMCQVCQDKTFK